MFSARSLLSRLPRTSAVLPSRSLSSLPSWATVDPYTMSASNVQQGFNLVNGEWVDTKETLDVVDPLNGEAFLKMPNTSLAEIDPFVQGLLNTPKSGLHNPFKNPERYVEMGELSLNMAHMMMDDDVMDFYTRLVQRVVPKSYAQCYGEVKVTRAFLQNFGGDQVRFLARSFGVSGDHLGQESRGYRWPLGPVALITPFNFPIEIPLLQLMGALFMGNRPCVHVDAKVAIVMEQVLRMMHVAGLPKDNVDFMVGAGPVMNEVLLQGKPITTQFTGSSKVGEKLALDLAGKIKLEDAGFDWKILGPDVQEKEYVAHVCDQDAYAASGQKCSAQSIVFAHSNWMEAGIVERMKALAARRQLSDLTIGPVITVTTETMMEHTKRLTSIPGAKLLFGGEPLTGHSIPQQYGAMQPTAVFVPLEQILTPEHFPHVTKEIFGPFQVVTEYGDKDVPKVLEALERMSHHLTAAVVSNDPHFTQHILGNTVNGTTYVGLRARTTGAPQNHWFGPAGDPRSAGIGSPEALKLVWSTHREIVSDVGPVPSGWSTPSAT